jgi:hypothetical protein
MAHQPFDRLRPHLRAPWRAAPAPSSAGPRLNHHRERKRPSLVGTRVEAHVTPTVQTDAVACNPRAHCVAHPAQRDPGLTKTGDDLGTGWQASGTRIGLPLEPITASLPPVPMRDLPPETA